MTAFDDLGSAARWVSWRNERRGKSGKPTKVPYGAGGLPAKADDPTTWICRREAEIRAKKIINGAGGGVGIQLGDLGADMHLGGVDLDACLLDGKLAPWAAAILAALDTYAEVSPSGTGMKAFFYIASEDVCALLDSVGVPSGQWGCRRDAPGGDARDHGPAVELYIARRYFAVTDQRWPAAPARIRCLDNAGFKKLAELIPPAKTASTKSARGDNSRSAKALAKGAALRREGKTFEEMIAALLADPETAEWCREKGQANNQRELRRIWNKAEIRLVDGAPSYSDEALALQFAALQDDALRYTPAWSRWFIWTGTHWRADDMLTAFDRTRDLCREASRSITDPRNVKLARMIAAAKTVAAVVNLARSDRRLATDYRDWDADPWRLATGSTLDLRTGASRDPLPSDLCTKITAVVPDNRNCPLWRRFLDRVTAGNAELQSYLQRVAGYCLTGSTREHVLFFLYGTGANGKSVFINSLRAIWGDYATIAPMETFIETQGERHPTELAHLRGARLVIAQETERGRRWAESKINTKSR